MAAPSKRGLQQRLAPGTLDDLWLSWYFLHAWENAEEPDSCYHLGQIAVYKLWSFSQLRSFTAIKDLYSFYMHLLTEFRLGGYR